MNGNSEEIWEAQKFLQSLIRKTNLGFLGICVSNLINKVPPKHTTYVCFANCKRIQRQLHIYISIFQFHFWPSKDSWYILLLPQFQGLRVSGRGTFIKPTNAFHSFSFFRSTPCFFLIFRCNSISGTYLDEKVSQSVSGLTGHKRFQISQFHGLRGFVHGISIKPTNTSHSFSFFRSTPCFSLSFLDA